ncbi:MAG: hypothetical protein LBP52_07635 [Burkholderiaceae bacterium]|jgi:hypothetical protein|nr:hypothetical protein [Burkholderiaceae bacterium]
MSQNETDASNGLQTGDEESAFLLKRFEGREAFAEWVRKSLQTAARQGWREIILCDATFADWPLGERAVIDLLDAWAGKQRQMTILAQRYDDLAERHARFVRWRSTWSHILDCRGLPSLEVKDFPSAIWSPSWVLQRLDLVCSRGIVSQEEQRRLVLREQLDECLGQSMPAFPATTLGL